MTDDFDASEAYASFLLDRTWFAQQGGVLEEADPFLTDAIAVTIEALEIFPGNRAAGNLLVRAAFQHWELKQEYVPDSILLKLPYYWSNSSNSWACWDADMAARKAIMLGDTARAGELTGYLMKRGYRDMSFLRVCEAYQLCQGQ